MTCVPISSIVIKNDTSTIKKEGSKDKIVKDTDKKFECVFVKDGETAKLRVIKTAIQDDSNIDVISGLQVGDEVITGPYNVVTKTLKTGDKVISETEAKSKK